MKNIKEIIIEKLIINKDSFSKQNKQEYTPKDILRFFCITPENNDRYELLLDEVEVWLNKLHNDAIIQPAAHPEVVNEIKLSKEDKNKINDNYDLNEYCNAFYENSKHVYSNNKLEIRKVDNVIILCGSTFGTMYFVNMTEYEKNK